MRLLMAICFSLIYIYGFPQDQMTNLKKYWRYRERLRDKFMVLSPNVDEPGVNIPMHNIRFNKTSFLEGNYNDYEVNWGDQNMSMPHYLTVLASEYTMLKANQYDNSQTIKELLYAMYALERLDIYSEAYIREAHGIRYIVNWPSDRNGFFLRDDVNMNFWNKYSSHFGLDSNPEKFTSNFCNDIYPLRELSQDIIYNLLQGLAMVNKLVGSIDVTGIPVHFTNPDFPIKSLLQDEGIIEGNIVHFNLWAQSFTDRLIKVMQHPDGHELFLFPKDENKPWTCKDDYHWEVITIPIIGAVWFLVETASNTICLIKSKWYIINPVTEKLVCNGSGSDFDMYLWYSYGACEAAQSITGTDYHFNNSNNILHIQAFKKILDRSVTYDLEMVDDLLYDLVEKMGTEFGVDIPSKEELADLLEEKIDDRYKFLSLATIGNIQPNVDPTLFELLRMRGELYEYEHFQLFYMILHGAEYSDLNTYYNSDDYSSDLDYYENLLNVAPCDGPKTYDLGYNDYALEYSTDSRCIWPEKNGIYSHEYIEYTGLDYMMLHNLYYYSMHMADFTTFTYFGSYFPPFLWPIRFTPPTYGIVKLGCSLRDDSKVTINATNYVTLEPGFNSANCGEFEVNIIDNGLDYKGGYFKKVEATTCPSFLDQ